jgi:hypothetical protein
MFRRAVAGSDVAWVLSHVFNPTPWAIGSGKLNRSAEAFRRTPPPHQRNLLFQPSSTTSDPLPGLRVVEWPPIFGTGFGLRCFQPLSRTAQLPGSALSDNRYTVGCDAPFLSYWGHLPLRRPAFPADKVRPVSRRSKPSSRFPLMGEQPYPWRLLHRQDGKSRQRGTKQRGRWELSPATSLLSPG